MKQAFDVTGNKPAYESMIADFTMSIREMSNIRRMSAKYEDPPTASFPQKRPSMSLPPSYRDVSWHSRSFHTALSTFWSCAQAHHTVHEARLFLDHRPDATLESSCAINHSSDSSTTIRSESLNLGCSSLPATFKADDIRQQNIRVESVRLGGEISSQQTQPSQCSSSISPSTAAPMDLRSCEDVCTQLCTQTMTARCSCYLDSSSNVRHLIHPVCDEQCDHKECLDPKALRATTQLDSIIGSTVELSRLSMNQQLRLALKLVNGILQFATTPWLQALWYLKDLSFFQTNDDLSAALATVHASSELSQAGHHELGMLDLSDELKEAMRSHGIGNVTLYSLGLALLQIGRWELLIPEPDDVSEVRRIADSSNKLGPVYQRITQKCLECNFGTSNDLSDPELQNAIYSDVVCELEGIIESLEGR
ncbi:hypothetical protein PG988_005720 [Apiospora saccharicola]